VVVAAAAKKAAAEPKAAAAPKMQDYWGTVRSSRTSPQTPAHRSPPSLSLMPPPSLPPP